MIAHLVLDTFSYYAAIIWEAVFVPFFCITIRLVSQMKSQSRQIRMHHNKKGSELEMANKPPIITARASA